jgi:FHA domain
MTVWLVALTEEARTALRGEQHVIERFPFKVGRESRLAGRKAWHVTERRAGGAPPLNDLYLLEPGEVLNVSREHFAIEHDGDRHVLVDRGSACGTLVEGRLVGGDRSGGRAELHDHDVIIVGTSASPFVFKFRSAP